MNSLAINRITIMYMFPTPGHDNLLDMLPSFLSSRKLIFVAYIIKFVCVR